MTVSSIKQTKHRKKSCHAIAMARARRAHQKGLNPVLIALLFVWAFLSAPFQPPRAAVLPTPRPILPPDGAEQAASDDWPVSDYERGLGGPLKWRTTIGSRYRGKPSLARLIADLRRPAARDDAAAALAIRIADPDVRAWATEKIHKGEINRLSIWVRPGSAEETVFTAWRGELDSELAEKAASPEKDAALGAMKRVHNA